VCNDAAAASAPGKHEEVEVEVGDEGRGDGGEKKQERKAGVAKCRAGNGNE
jgi:hypothetical protein